MRRIFAFLVVVLGLLSPANAQRNDVEETIAAQIKAFQGDDFGKALSHACPNSQQMFRTVRNFVVMVRRGCLIVWRPDQIKFLELRDVDDSL